MKRTLQKFFKQNFDSERNRKEPKGIQKLAKERLKKQGTQKKLRDCRIHLSEKIGAAKSSVHYRR